MKLKTLFLGAVLAGFASAAMAQSNEPQRAETGSTGAFPAAVSPKVVAKAPNAQLAGLIRRDLTILRNKGISKVKHNGTGIYCITPDPALNLNVDNIIVTLTPEFYYSTTNAIMVQWATKGSGCPKTDIAVYTLSDNVGNGQFFFSNAASFSIVVP